MPDPSERIFGLDFSTFFSLIDNMYDEVLIYDGNYNIVYINQACRRHYCCQPDHMIGKSFWDFVNTDWWHPSILPVVYKQKKSYAIKQVTYMGSELLTVAVPIFDENNEIRYVIMNVRDMVQDIDLYNPHYLTEPVKPRSDLVPIAVSKEMQRVLSLVHKIGAVETTSILTGESGVGKTMIARYMHHISPRKGGPYIGLNCATIPGELIESELFGYSKGAFTGANSSGKKGLIEAADKGTLLLDEVSELSPAAQAKLLHVLQDKEFMPLGGNKLIKVDVKIIAATNKNLKNLVDAGAFREDLYYRLNVVDIYIPPLRKRRSDIPHLISHFMHHFCSKYGVSRQFSDRAVNMLVDMQWKGNVRELRHVIERLVVTMDSLIIDVSQLPKNMFGIEDASDAPLVDDDLSFDEKVSQFKSHLVQEAFQKCGSSRKLAEYLSISQSKANNLIRQYIKDI